MSYFNLLYSFLRTKQSLGSTRPLNAFFIDLCQKGEENLFKNLKYHL